MIPLEEAQAHVLGRCRAVAPQRIALRAARGTVIAEDIVATELVPPWDNTAVDGFAVRAADTTAAPVTLPVVDTLAAGVAPSRALGAGEAIRIMTGAPLPEGADAVVMVETTSVDDEQVTIHQAVAAGDNVRRAGDDLRPGTTVLPAGTVLSAGHLGVLASLGVYEPLVYPRVRVGVFSTGDELVESPAPLPPGRIRDTNRHALLALCDEAGFDAVDLGLLPDDEAIIEAAVARGAADCDALLTSGGVSMGDYDYVKVVLDRLGEMRWMQVAIRPAKPLAFGTVGDTPVFGLPGNPVSSMVSFELFARPALRQMMGHTEVHRPRFHGVAADDFSRRPDGKTHFARVRVAAGADGWAVRSAGGQGSHQLTAMADADALAALPDGTGVLPGGSVEFFFLGDGPGR